MGESAERSERVRGTLRAIELADVLRECFGQEMQFQLRCGAELRATLRAVTAQWILLETQRSHVLALTAVRAIRLGNGARLNPAGIANGQRRKPQLEQSLVALLDELSRRRIRVRLPNEQLSGRINAVGRDFFVFSGEHGEAIVSLASFEQLEVLDGRIEF